MTGIDKAERVWRRIWFGAFVFLFAEIVFVAVVVVRQAM